MARYFVTNLYSGEICGEFNNMDLADEHCSSLNSNLPYFSDEKYRVLDEKAYAAYNGEEEDTYEQEFIQSVKVWYVVGVGRYRDGARHSADVIADTREEARKLFEKRYPQYRAIDASEIKL